MGHIFISYSHFDSEYTHRLAETLQAEGFDVWIDARIDYGAQWSHEIQKQLDSCDAFLLIMTPRSFASEWVQSELHRAKRKSKSIFPLLLEGDEPWLSVESTQYYDVRGGKLPDSKFHSALKRIVPHSEGQAVQLPADNVKKPVKAKASVNVPKMKTEVVVAIIGAIVTLVAAVIPLIWSNLSQNAPPDPENDATAASSVTEVPPVVSSTPSKSYDLLDSKGIPMQLVPAGKFTMGSNDKFPEEKPVHEVYLDAYLIDQYEVTNEFYKACVDTGACQPPQNTSSYTHTNYYGNPEFANYPVVFIDWHMAKTYCEWRGAHLPTEAQWEKAARGVDGRIYPWGNSFDGSIVNFCDANCSLEWFDKNYDDRHEELAPVGSYPQGASPYGLHDMSGNVFEWVSDWYDDTYYMTISSNAVNPQGPRTGEERVMRGASWYYKKVDMYSSYRNKSDPTDIYNDVGFRCARGTSQ